MTAIDQIDGIERLMFANGIFELSADGSLVPFDEAANADNQQSRLLLIDGIDISRYLNNTVDSTDEAVHTDMVPGFYTLHEGALSRLENDPPPVGEWIAAGLAASAVAGVHMGSRDVVGGRRAPADKSAAECAQRELPARKFPCQHVSS